jgi:hypothetical protein
MTYRCARRLRVGDVVTRTPLIHALQRVFSQFDIVLLCVCREKAVAGAVASRSDDGELSSTGEGEAE